MIFKFRYQMALVLIDVVLSNRMMMMMTMLMKMILGQKPMLAVAMTLMYASLFNVIFY